MSGVDKTLLDFGGRPLVRVVVDAISALFEEVLIASGTADRLPGFQGARQVPDAADGIGPLAGIRAGLAAARTDWVFVVAADMPFIDTSLIARILSECGDGHQAVIPRIGDRLEPLHAAYRTDLVPLIDQAIRRGDRKVMRAFEGIAVRWIDLEEADRACFFNVNYPSDLGAQRPRGGRD